MQSIVSTKEVEQQHTIDVLDGVRAFACFSVISYHINRAALDAQLWSPGGIGNILAGIFLSGYSGVTLFFMLSGFLLFMKYCRSLLFDSPWQSTRTFYLRRVFRIWPGYFVSLSLLILLTHREYLRPDHLRQLALFLTFLMDSSKVTFQQINGPFWTLAVEWQFYILLPLLALGMRKLVQRGTLRRRVIVLALCLGGLFLWGIVTRWWGYAWVHDGRQMTVLPAPLNNVILFFLYGCNGKSLEDFAVGMMVCTVYTIVRYYRSGQVLGQFLHRYCVVFWVLGLGCLFFATTWPSASFHSFVAPYLSAGRSLSEVPFSSGFALCMLALLFGARWLTWFWSWMPVRWLGFLSYGLYIWHLPFIITFNKVVLPHLPASRGIWIYLLFWLMMAAVVLPFCYLFYRLIETPWIELGHRFTRKKQAPQRLVAGSFAH